MPLNKETKPILSFSLSLSIYIYIRQRDMNKTRNIFFGLLLTNSDMMSLHGENTLSKFKKKLICNEKNALLT